MKEGPKTGKCRLCGNTGELRDSHIFPKAAYKRILRGPDVETPERAPVMFTQEATVQINYQLREHLLCERCEEAFNKLETYAFPLLSQADGSFPWLASTRPIQQTRAADSSAVDVPKLTAFVTSIFWRLSVTRHTTLALGPYEEAFRRYLRGEEAFPVQARLGITLIDHSQVTLGRVDRLHGFNNAKRAHGYTRQELTILGVNAKLFVGRLLPPALDAISFPHRSVVMVRAADDFARELAPQLAASPVKGSLARSG